MKTTLNFRLLFLIFAICSCSFTEVLAQKESRQRDEYVMIKMIDGTRIIGKKLATTPESVIVDTELAGKLNIPYEKIDRMRSTSRPYLVDGQYWTENRNYTRNVIGPTGYGLKKGEGYYQNFFLFFHNVSYGFTDNFSLGFGTEMISLINSIDIGTSFNPGFVINPKFSFPLREDEINVSVSGVAVHVPESSELFDFGALFGTATFGSKDKNVSIGLGFGVAEGDISSSPGIALSGNLRVSNGFAFTSENWIFPSFEALLVSFGVRVIGERVNWDFALFGAGDGDFFSLSPIPLVGAVIPFGGR
jgi:hypothetical protein